MVTTLLTYNVGNLGQNPLARTGSGQYAFPQEMLGL